MGTLGGGNEVGKGKAGKGTEKNVGSININKIEKLKVSSETKDNF